MLANIKYETYNLLSKLVNFGKYYDKKNMFYVNIGDIRD